MSIDETALGRWSRLKKARKDRDSGTDQPSETMSSEQTHGHGSAAPTAFPVDVSGEYRPWLPPLTEGGEPEDSDSLTEEPRPSERPLELSEEDKAIAAEMELPDIETLEEGSDFSVFLSDRVPDTLRRLALRKLWASNPLFGFRDGLNDYDEDFRALSDFVYNSEAMKRFTEGPKESDEPVSENAEAGNDKDGAGQGEDDAPTESDEARGENPDDASASTETAEIDEDEHALEEDDPELG